MSSAMKKIAVLTSGGDAPGMNAAIRAVTRTALTNGVEVLGVYRGYNGLIAGDFEDMKLRNVSGILQRGGTILYTARCPEFKTEEGMQKAIKTCREHEIDGLVVMGGDGSFRGARDLSDRGLPCVAVPCTIDNDISSCDETIGYDTAMNTCVELVDKLRDTAQSHDRCSVVEVMGRHAGYLALNVGIAVGATSIVVPEVGFDFERDIVERFKASCSTGKKHFIVIVAEGIGNVAEITEKIQSTIGVETRATVLGHVQRGGSPTLRDRVLASSLGNHAVHTLLEGRANRVIATRKTDIFDMDINEALAMEKPFDNDLLRIAHEISI